MITLIDLDIGNLQSVANAFRRIGAEVTVVTTAREIEGARVLVLPGVGAFERAMTNLNERGLGPVLREQVAARRSTLIGICLGMQLLATRSYEHGVTEGLGLIPGEVRLLEPSPPKDLVPNIGWLPVNAVKPSAMFPQGVDGEAFYHVHSYHLVCNDPSDVAATFMFGGQPITTAVERDNVFGVQFHPEKSQDAGLNLLHSLVTHVAASDGTAPALRGGAASGAA
jgi:glutamine amidotransferase